MAIDTQLGWTVGSRTVGRPRCESPVLRESEKVDSDPSSSYSRAMAASRVTVLMLRAVPAAAAGSLSLDRAMPGP